MRILIAGATGALGRHLVPRLTAAGHQVVGTTRHPAKIEMIRRLGAEPAIVDGLDGAKVREVVRAAQPEVIVHEMTDLSRAGNLRHFDRAFATSNLLRTVGLDHLLAAVRDSGVKRIVAQSFCGWPYAREGAAVKSEDDALDPHPPRELRRTLDAIRYLEDRVMQAPDLDGVVLRYGGFYGAGTGLFDNQFMDQVAKRRVPVIGTGAGWWSFIHIEDAANATALAVERGRPGSIYNIVDDEPAPVCDWLPFVANLLGAKPPRHLPSWLARIAAGQHLVVMMTDVRAGSNAKAKKDLQWELKYPSWRAGFCGDRQATGLVHHRGCIKVVEASICRVLYGPAVRRNEIAGEVLRQAAMFTMQGRISLKVPGSKAFDFRGSLLLDRSTLCNLFCTTPVAPRSRGQRQPS